MYVRWSLEASSAQGKIHSNPEIVEDHNGAPRLEMPRDHSRVVQHSRYQLQSWRANGDVSLILSNSPPDNPARNWAKGTQEKNVREGKILRMVFVYRWP